MSTHVISTIADKLLHACCADELCSKLPFKKTNHDDADNVDVTAEAEEKKEDSPDAEVVKPVGTAAKKTNYGHFTPSEMKYELTFWKDLPLDAQGAAQELGFDEAKWNGSEYVDVAHEHWHDLSEKQLKALKVLGWEEEAWEHKYKHFDWVDLPDLQKRAAESVGYTEENWDGPPHEQPLHHKYWEEMSEEEKSAMAVFGYTMETWDE